MNRPNEIANALQDMRVMTLGHLRIVLDCLQRIEPFGEWETFHQWPAAHGEKQILCAIQHLHSALEKTREYQRCESTYASLLDALASEPTVLLDGSVLDDSDLIGGGA